METYYPRIGTIKQSQIPNSANSGDYLFSTCIRKAQDQNKKFVAFPNVGINEKGTCYLLENWNPVEDNGTTSDIPVYSVPDPNCVDSLSGCLKEAGENFLVKELSDVKKELEENNAEKRALKIKEIAIKNNYTRDVAEKVYEQSLRQEEIEKENENISKQVSNTQESLSAIEIANKNTNYSLTDKNRVLATVNSDAQNRESKLTEVNDKINTITQDIYYNNILDKRKNQIIGILRTFIIIFVIMTFLMVIYYGVKFSTKNFSNLNISGFSFSKNKNINNIPNVFNRII